MSTNNHTDWRDLMPNVDKHPMTHHGECWRVHHACAILKIERLQEEIDHLKEVMNSYDIAVFDNNVVKVSKKE